MERFVDKLVDKQVKHPTFGNGVIIDDNLFDTRTGASCVKVKFDEEDMRLEKEQGERRYLCITPDKLYFVDEEEKAEEKPADDVPKVVFIKEAILVKTDDIVYMYSVDSTLLKKFKEVE